MSTEPPPNHRLDAIGYLNSLNIFTLGTSYYVSKYLLQAFLLFKTTPFVVLMAGPIIKWLSSVAESLYRVTASLTLVNFSFSQVAAKPTSKTYMLSSRYDNKPSLKHDNFYFLNSVNLDLVKNLTQVSLDADGFDAKPSLSHQYSGKEKNKLSIQKTSLSTNLTLATEKLSKTASFSYDITTDYFQYSEYTHYLLPIHRDKQHKTFQDLFTYLNPADRKLLHEKWDLLLATGQEFDEVIRLDINNERTWLRIKAITYTNNIDCNQVIGTIQDITDYKQREEQLIAQRVEAEKAKEAKSDFVSLMSHEIRTPLNAILGLTYLLLQEENLDDKHKENLESIHFSSETLMGLINRTLDYSRIEAGKIELEKIDFSLKEVLKGIHRTLHHRAAEKNLEFNLSIDEDTPELVTGDSARLSQILNNLTSNALKFTQTGNVTISSKVLYESDQDYVIEFAVADTGVGIPEDRQDKIFESFVQASASTHRQYGGTGLGLAITKKIIELHKGQIKLISAPGKGSTFKVWLRYSKPTAESRSMAPIIDQEISYTDLSGAKVLVVDDNPMNKLVARKLLQRWHIEVDTAENGAIALDKVKSNFYNLVLMDINMPVMNGFESLIEIRKFNTTMPVIALTASAREEEKNKVLALGGNDYVSKPFVPEELYQKLMQHLVPTKNS